MPSADLVANRNSQAVDVAEIASPSDARLLVSFAPELGLVALLIIEILSLTNTFDTGPLDSLQSLSGQIVNQSPQLLRLAITATLVTLVLDGRQILSRFRGGLERASSASRLWALLGHAAALACFVAVTNHLISGDVSALEHRAPWTLVWFVTGGATVAACALAVFPLRVWAGGGTRRYRRILLGGAIGTLIWACGFITQEFWQPLATITFSLVAWMLGVIYPVTVMDPSRLLVGTPTFKAIISPQCSGYEGVGLILAFLSIYMWHFRKDLRFPAALLLLPLGALTIWIVNVLRIVLLIVIGTAGWRSVAAGGFHSQAGWIAFNLTALGFVALTFRVRSFMVAAPPSVSVREADGTTAFLAPFAAITAAAMVTGAFSAGFDWLYPLRVVVAVAVLWHFRGCYAQLTWAWSWVPFAIGGVTFLVWLALMPEATGDKDAWPTMLRAAPTAWASVWMISRVVGYVAIAPLVEELAFRGFLIRRLVTEDFERLPLRNFYWIPVVISSVLFGALHGRMWLAGTLAGLAFAIALGRRGVFGHAVQAHAVTNGLLAVYAFTTGHWSAWS